MSVTGVTNNIKFTTYGRLLEQDIKRLPALKIDRIDYYQGSNANTSKTSKNNYWNKFFTVATFGLTGLYIAHRNNLFNPIKREAKKIIKNSDLKDRLLKFADEAINPETYKKATTKYLNELISGKNSDANVANEAQKILKNNESFDKLSKLVEKRLLDDSDTTRFKQGFVVDLLDRLNIKIEKNLNKAKNHGLPYKNQGSNIVESVFAKANNAPSLVEETLYESINNRSSVTIDNFIKDSLISQIHEKALQAAS